MKARLKNWPQWLFLVVGLLLWAAPARSEEHKEGPPAVVVLDAHHKPVNVDLANPREREKLMEGLVTGEIASIEVEHKSPNPADLGIWTLVVFLALVLILGKYAWGPIMDGLHKREATIRDSVEEAKKARAETERISAEFKVKMDQAYAEIPKIMEQARREAEAFKEDMRTQTAKEVQAERQRLRREIDTARDQALQELWSQAAQLATLISAKAIGRSLTEEDHRRLQDEAISELAQTASR